MAGDDLPLLRVAAEGARADRAGGAGVYVVLHVGVGEDDCRIRGEDVSELPHERCETLLLRRVVVGAAAVEDSQRHEQLLEAALFAKHVWCERDSIVG